MKLAQESMGIEPNSLSGAHCLAHRPSVPQTLTFQILFQNRMAGDSNATPLQARTVFQTGRVTRTRSPSDCNVIVRKVEASNLAPFQERPRFRDEFRGRPVTFLNIVHPDT